MLTSWGLNLSSSLFGQTWRRRQNNTEHGEGIRSSLFLSENIFFLVSSHSRHFSGVYVRGPIHYLPLLLQETVTHMASVLCVCFGVCLCCFETANRERCAYWHTCCTSLCTCVCERECCCEWRIDGWVRTYICLLLFIACSIFCIT